MGRATSTRTTRPTRASIRTTSPRRSAGASTTSRPTAGSRRSSAGGSPSGGAGAPSGGGRRHSRVVLRPEELVALAPARLRRRLPPELFRLRVVGTTRGRDRVARGEARRRQGVPREDRPRRRDLHGLRVQLPDAARAGRGVRPRRVRRRRAGGDARVDVSPAGNAGLDLPLGRVPRARGGRVRLPRHVGAPPPRARQPRPAGGDHGDPVPRMSRLRVGVVFVGRSGEHEVSLASAASVITALEARGHTVVPIGIARDGRWVVGGDPLRALAAEARVALPSDDGAGEVKKALADRADAVDSAATASLARTEPAGGLPAEVRHLDVVVIMLHGPYGEDGTIQGLVERAVSGREIEVSVLGNNEPVASLPGEITYAGEFYDYATKYVDGQARLTVPAPLPAETTRRIRELALEAYRAIDCAGMARVDFFLEGDRILVNEINTIPGFTATSGYARMWEASGLGYGELLDRLIELALERQREKTRGG